ncbi:MAG: hypothetical protein GY930_08295 [bacterium]|nr:hypothetical protein [bacterium]
MSDDNNKPFNETDLDSPEYRERLMRKINCLIAVLEVASAKVKRSIDGPSPDMDRLVRIQTNLISTLEVCRRARRALERREALPEGLPENLAAVVRQVGKETSKGLPEGSMQELSSPEELERFKGMGAIKKEEIESVDFDALSRSLME